MKNVFTIILFLLLTAILSSLSGQWTQKTDIPTGRSYASACEVDGKIYVIGGGATTKSCMSVMEVYDPETNTWDKNIAPMLTPRVNFCAGVVNGKIYVIGGTTGHTNSNGIIGSVEVYDPATDTWQNKTPMPVPRRAAACGVIDNKIYVAGGSPTSWYGSNTNKLEAYDPVTDTWDTTKDNMPKTLFGPRGAVLDGKFYIVGGVSSTTWTGQTSVQIYDPVTNTWELGPNLINGRFDHSLEVVGGKLFVIGGLREATSYVQPTISQVEVYDPAQDSSWSVVDSTPVVMNVHASSVYNDTIYLFSGSRSRENFDMIPTKDVYSYKPPEAEEQAWNRIADIPTARIFASSCTLNDKIYVLGGDPGNGQGISNMEVYDPVMDSWDVTKQPMPTSRLELGVCTVNEKIYAIGGASTHGGSAFGTVEEYDPSSNSWISRTAKPSPRKGAAYGVIDNKIYVAGGTAASYNIASNKLEVYDPVTDTWDITKEAMLKAVYVPTGAVIDNKFYVIGGLVGSPWTGQKTVQIYDLITDTWSLGPDLLEGRAVPTTNVVNGKLYVIGGDSELALVTSIEEYDPNSNSWKTIDQKVELTMNTSCVLGNKIYLISGSTTPYMNLTWTSAVYSFNPDLVTSIDVEPNYLIIPNNFALHQNYPNPFNPTTTIKYSIPYSSVIPNSVRDLSTQIPDQARNDNVILKVYDILGREMATLVNQKQKPGNYEVEWDAKNQPSGVYFYQLNTGNYTETKKMILLR